jgi:hypothetical protein
MSQSYSPYYRGVPIKEYSQQQSKESRFLYLDEVWLYLLIHGRGAFSYDEGREVRSVVEILR